MTREEIELNAKKNSEVYIAGIWGHNAFDSLEQLEQIAKDIEIEFRKIYGTNE